MTLEEAEDMFQNIVQTLVLNGLTPQEADEIAARVSGRPENLTSKTKSGLTIAKIGPKEYEVQLRVSGENLEDEELSLLEARIHHEMSGAKITHIIVDEIDDDSPEKL